MHDLHLARRFLLRDRAFVLLAVLVLALGIGGVATQFSVVNGLLLRPPAYPHGERLMAVSLVDRAQNRSVGGALLPDYLEMREVQQSFEEFAAFAPRLSINLTHQNAPRRYNGVYVTHNFFRTLGVRPILGRDFAPDDDREAAAPTVVISHEVWVNDFAGSLDVVGRAVRINGRPGTVIGVMPAGFSFPLNEQVWAPMLAEFPPRSRDERQGIGPSILGRLKPGVTAAQAAAELTVQARRFAAAWPATNQHLTAVSVAPFADAFLDPQTKRVMYVMLGAVLVVLLIACVNVMNMQFARAARRMRDLAVCSALGASRWRLLRQMLIESLAIAGAGALGGTLLALWATDLLLRQARTLRAPPPSWVTFDLDGRVLAVTLAATVAAALLSGLLPAWLASRSRPLDSLRDGGRGGTSRRVNLTIRGLVVLQIALTAALLIAASFMIRSIVNQHRIDWGYDTSTVLTARVTLLPNNYPEGTNLAQFYARTLETLRADSNFAHAALSTRFRLAIPINRTVELEGIAPGPREADIETGYDAVSDGYFDTLGMQMLSGRDFRPTDTFDTMPVAIVNASFARRHFGLESPLGRRVRFTGRSSPPGRWLTIVGVAPDTRMQGPLDSTRDGSGVFQPLAQAPQRWITIAVRGRAGETLALGEPLRRAIARVEGDLPIYLVNTAAFVIDETLAQGRLLASLFFAFGGVAVVLAAVGLYGMMSFAVNQRTHEYGIRMALGADARRILHAILREGALQLVVGLAAGLTLAIALVAIARSFMREFLYDVSATDPLVWGATVLLLTLVALGACLVPARRAARVDPLVALRAE